MSGSLGLWAQSDIGTSLDFDYEGINYTILDQEAKTCKTKAGSAYFNSSTGSPTIVVEPGNTIEGPIDIPSVVSRNLEGGLQENYTVVAIGECSFKNVSSVTIPETVTSIGNSAFNMSMELTTVKMGDGVSTMGTNVFSGCPKLTDVKLSNSLTSIPANTFSSCTSLTSLEIPETVTSIGDRAFSSCSALQSISLPSSLTQIGNSAFYGCTHLSGVVLPEHLNTLSSYAFFYNYGLTSITLPESLSSIGEGAFANCNNLKEVICQASSLPAISSGVFSESTYSGKLLVYNSMLSAFKKSPLWGKFSTIEPIYVAPETITLDRNATTINVGLSQQLTASLSPNNAVGQIIWTVTSSPENAVTVSDSGKILAQRSGTAEVTASCGELKATCQVTVIPNPGEAVTISPIGIPVYVGDQIQMSAIVRPSTILTPVSWASSNPAVAIIDPVSGNLTAIGPGGTLITAQCEGITGKLSVTVLPILAQSVTLDKTSLTLKASQTALLSATVNPYNTTNPEVLWETSDPNVAVVSNGTVTAIGVGECIIRASCGEAIANCNVTVEPTMPESISLSDTSLTMKPGQTSVISATVLPETTTDKTVSFLSSNPEVAIVSVDGTITALSVGSTVINASCGNKSANCTVKVEPILATEVILNYTSLNLMLKQVQQLTATVADEVTDKNIIWTSDDENIATVSNGLVTAAGLGTTIIKATNGNISGQCSVTVLPIPVESITLDPSSLELNVNDTKSIVITITPTDATNPEITWEASDTHVVSVADGIITAKAPGNSTIYAFCQNQVASCSVKVWQPATSISLNQTTLNLMVGEMEDIIALPEPQNTTDEVIWSSSDPKIVSVNEHGIVEAISVGTATITVTCGKASASCTVNVSEIVVTEIKLNTYELNLSVSESFNLTATILPDNATDKSVTWKSDNPKIATVSADGTVKGISSGIAVITVTSGKVSANCSVTVVEPDPEAVIISYSQINLHATETFLLSATVGGKEGDYNFIWTSGNESVAVVNQDGLVTALIPGNAIITASYGDQTAECLVTVETTAASSVILNFTELRLSPEETALLTATVYPEYTTNKDITWVSDNPAIASVDGKGNVKAIAEGYTVITAYCGNVFSQCVVTVSSPSQDNPGSGDEGNGGNNPGGDTPGEGDGNPENPDDGNSVEEIIDDYIFYDVFTINGVRVLHTKEKNDLKRLENGLYIINGKKVLIKN